VRCDKVEVFIWGEKMKSNALIEGECNGGTADGERDAGNGNKGKG